MNQQLTAAKIAELVSGSVTGDPDTAVTAIKPLSEAGPGDLTFFAPTSKKQQARLLSQAAESRASVILVTEPSPEIQAVQITVKNPLESLIRVSQVLHPPYRPPTGVHPLAAVEKSASIGENSSVGPFAVVGADAVIGANCTIHAHVVIYPAVKIGDGSVIHAGAVIREGVTLGKSCLIQPGVVIGGDGFGYISRPGAGHSHIPHIGTVNLGDRVDVGANATIDRATLGRTVVGEGTKIDNLVMVAHNVKIGSHSFLCSQVGIAGSAEVGDWVILGGQVGVADHAHIGSQVRVAAQSGVHGEVAGPTDVAGTPARPAANWRREEAALAQLPKIVRHLRSVLRDE